MTIDTKIVDRIKTAVDNIEQIPIFKSNNNEEDLINACKVLLRSLNYVVIDPIDKKVFVKNVNDLVSFFYVCAERFNPKYAGLYRNLSKDRAIAKRFVEARMAASNKDFESALQECVLLIDIIFKHYAEFHFNRDISLGILGQKAFGWVTEKAIKFLNEEYNQNKEDLIEQKRNNMLKDSDQDLGFSQEELVSILSKLNN